MKNTHKLLSVLLLAISFLAPVDAMKKRKGHDENVFECNERNKPKKEILNSSFLGKSLDKNNVEIESLSSNAAQLIINDLTEERCFSIADVLIHMHFDHNKKILSIDEDSSYKQLTNNEKLLIKNIGKADILHKFLEKEHSFGEWGFDRYLIMMEKILHGDRSHCLVANAHTLSGGLQTNLMQWIASPRKNLTLYYGYNYEMAVDREMHTGVHWQMVHAMLKDERTNPDLQDAEGLTALHYGVRHKQLEAVEALLNHPKINIDIKDYEQKNENGKVTHVPQTAYDYLPPEDERDGAQKIIAMLFRNYVFKHRAYNKFFGNPLKK